MTSGVRRPRIAAVILTAGQSRRMGANKLLVDLHGKPLVRHTVEHVIASGFDAVTIVTGYMASEVQAALAGLDVRYVHNQHYVDGMATSIRAGVAAARDFDAVLISLGDMPLVKAADMQRMIAAFHANDERAIVAPVFEGRISNPVLWGRNYFPALMALRGDKGARSILESQHDRLEEIAIDHDGILLDADTPEALALIKKRLE